MNRIQPDTALPKEVKIGKYVAKLTQTGTTAPTALELQNTTGKTITYERTGAGIYNLIISNEDITTTPATLLIQSSNPTTIIGTSIFSDTKYGIQTRNSSSGNLEDDRLTQATTILELYNY